MADKRNVLNYASAGPRPRWRLSGRVRWVGLVVFAVGLWVYVDWGGSDYLISRWGLGGAIAGALVYFEGLAASIREGLAGSAQLPTDDEAG